MVIEGLLTWGVLLVVLIMIARGRSRIELPALAGLLVLGLADAASPQAIFSGFGHPALATIIAVLMVSQGIVDSHVLRGLGQAIARRLSSLHAQVISIAGAGALLSAFMNNVGAVGLMLPTAVRMAQRSGHKPGVFGMPLAMASILGGTLTLIGSAPNIIIASYMATATGRHFGMFDFMPHGGAMLLTAILFWLLLRASGRIKDEGENSVELPEALDDDCSHVYYLAPLATRERRLTSFIVLAAILLVSLGLVHPSLGFGAAAFLLVLFGVLKLPAAYKNIDLGIIFFLGSMLGIGKTLEETGALDLLSQPLAHYAAQLPPFLIILLLIYVSSALSNGINNAAAAVFMAPLAVGVAEGSSIEVSAALMAVAAGSNMTLLLPTHQAALMVMSKAPFSTASFLRAGVVLSFACGLAAAGAITLVWQ